jgi:FtsH-binding integral membrane protein
MKTFINILIFALFIIGLTLLFNLVFELNVIKTIFSLFVILILLGFLTATPEMKKKAPPVKGGEKCLPWM